MFYLSGGCTFTVHVGIDMQLTNMILWYRFNPHTLPDTAAGCIPYMRGFRGLLAYWDDIITTICWVMHKDQTNEAN